MDEGLKNQQYMITETANLNVSILPKMDEGLKSINI